MVPAAPNYRSGHRYDGAHSLLAAPFLAGATLQLKEGGGFTAVRGGPPLRGKGLPSKAQVNEGLTRSATKERKLAAKNSSGNGSSLNNKASGAEHNKSRGANVEPGTGTTTREEEEEFAVMLARRDDVLQVTPPPKQIMIAL